MNKLKVNEINDFFTNYSLDLQKKRHDEMLVALTKLVIGRISYINNVEDILCEINYKETEVSLQESCSKILGKIIEEKGLSLQGHNFGNFSNSEFKKLLDFLEQEINEEISRYTFKFSKEEILVELLSLASVISKLNIIIFTEYNILYKPIDNLESLGIQLKFLDKMNFDDLRSFIGDIKMSIECAVDTVLIDDDLKFSSSQSSKPVNYIELIRLFHAKSFIQHIKEAIPILGEARKEFKLNNENGIVLPQILFKGFFNYSQSTKNEKAQVENDLTNNLFNIFYESLEFQPSDIYSYVGKNEGERAFRLFDNYLTLADKELLVVDIKNKQGLTLNGINNLLDILTLNNKSFNTNDKSKNEDSYFASPNKRLFRAPIIDLDSKILMPTYTWIESLIYLPARILNRDIYSDAVTKNWNELIKTSYDEYYLPELKQYLESMGISASINMDLGKINCLKKEIENIKKMPHEIDLLFWEDNTLIIMDLKNYGMQHNYRDVRLVIDKIDKQIKKMNKLKNFILLRKEKFESILKKEIDEIKIGVITVSPTVYNYLQNKNSSAAILSIKEFKDKYKRN